MKPDLYGDLYAPIEWRRPDDHTYRDIFYETAEGIAKITICRPEVRNAFRPQTLFELAQAFSAFYENCPVLKAESDEVKESRLTLCALVFRVMTTGLDLLGLESPEQM